MNNIVKLFSVKRLSYMPVSSQRYKVRKKVKNSIEATQHREQKVYGRQIYDYFLVMDLEATCIAPKSSIPFEQEIIEFPVYKVNASSFKTEEIFHSFVKPVVNPKLSNFCSRLTGITQLQVDDKFPLEVVLQNFDHWFQEQVIKPEKAHIFVTSGDWDLRVMLPEECRRKSIDLQPYFHSYINLNKSFAYATGKWPRFGKGRLPAMLSILGLESAGELHRGTSDCENIIKIMDALACNGYVFKHTL